MICCKTSQWNMNKGSWPLIIKFYSFWLFFLTGILTADFHESVCTHQHIIFDLVKCEGFRVG